MLDAILISTFVLGIGALTVKHFFKDTITWKEFGIQTVAQTLLVIGIIAASFHSHIYDTRVVSGEVVKKYRDKVSCEHSYSCNCRQSCSGSGSSRSCSTRCQTCYDHSHDYDWVVKANIGSRVIARVDRRGTKEPPRFTEVKIGDPFSRAVGFTNYIKAVPQETLFSVSADNAKFFDQIPEYPKQIYDYYKSVRVVTSGKINLDAQKWNEDIAIIQKKLGPAKDANMIFLITDQPDQSYRYAVESKWLGGKLNDVIVLIGAPDFPKIGWVDVITYGRNKGNELTSIMIRDELMAKGQVTDDIPHITAGIITKKYDRISETEFEYLKDSVTLTTGQMVMIFIISLIMFIGLTWFFHKNEV